ncbi:MAG: hypothetical protein KAJ63_14200 [Methyloprofundus sp.]|nr:hypothetical protein [Methyloprofundus sp.]
MQQKIHMQDQVKNRINMIMGEHNWLHQFIDDLLTVGFIITVLALGVIW